MGIMQQSGSTRFECLDGLRGVAAIWVIVGHCLILTGWHVRLLIDADLGVDLFIVLSGFLMTYHYLLRQEKEPWSSSETWIKFWMRRYFRIAPLFYVMLTFAILAGARIFSARMQIDGFLNVPPQLPERYIDNSWSDIISHVTFIFGFIPRYAFSTPLPDWSLGLEMQFYAVFPFVMIVIASLGWSIGSALIATVSLSTWIVLKHFAINFPMPAFLPLKIQVFGCGMLLAGAVGSHRPRALAHFGLALLLIAIPVGGGHSLFKIAARLAIASGFFALVLHDLLPGKIGVLTRAAASILGNRFCHHLGELSFGAYLVHLLIMQPVAAEVIAVFGQDISASTRFALALTMTLPPVYLIAWFTYRVVEIPGQRLGALIIKKLPVRPRSVKSPATASF